MASSGFLVTSIIIPVYPSERCRELNSSFTRVPSSARVFAYYAVVVGADGRATRREKSEPTGFANHPPGRDRGREDVEFAVSDWLTDIRDGKSSPINEYSYTRSRVL